MATQCEVKREMLRVVPVPRSGSLSPNVRVKAAAKRSSSSPASIHNDTGTPPPDSPRKNLLTVDQPQGENDTASPRRDATSPEPSAQPQGSTEPCTPEQDNDLSEGVAEEAMLKPDTEGRLMCRNSSFLTISTVSDDPSDSDVERSVKKIR